MRDRSTHIPDKVRELKAAQAAIENREGVVHDMDTVLADIHDEADPCVSGIGLELIGLYEQADNPDQFMALFESLTGVSWGGYLDRSLAAIRDTIGSDA